MKSKSYEILERLLQDYYDEIVEANTRRGTIYVKFKDFVIEAYGLEDKFYNLITTTNKGVEFKKIGLLNLYPYVDIKFEIESIKYIK